MRRRERRGCGIGLALSRWEWRCTDIGYRGHLTTNDVVGADIVEPTTIIFAGIDIELDGDILAILNIELLDAVFTKDIKQTTSGILARDLNHIFLRHPRVATTGGDTAAGLHYGNNSTC